MLDARRYRWAGGLYSRTTATAVLLLAGEGEPKLLEGTAQHIWELFEIPRSTAEVTKALAETYGVPASEITDPLEAFVGELVAEGFLSASE